ncbi:MAG TPA: hypothetical protein VNW99_10785 [Cytophagaceae bacterium]|jgi:hypothetical protein|nr:hypothetical protein [Cytophagaceae bacterium]
MERQEDSRLTIEELRKFEGLENITDGEAEDALSTIEKLTILIFNQHQRLKQSKHEKRKNTKRKTKSKSKEEQN